MSFNNFGADPSNFQRPNVLPYNSPVHQATNPTANYVSAFAQPTSQFNMQHVYNARQYSNNFSNTGRESAASAIASASGSLPFPPIVPHHSSSSSVQVGGPHWQFMCPIQSPPAPAPQAPIPFTALAATSPWPISPRAPTLPPQLLATTLHAIASAIIENVPHEAVASSTISGSASASAISIDLTALDDEPSPAQIKQGEYVSIRMTGLSTVIRYCFTPPPRFST